MNELFNTSINVHTVKEHKITATECLTELYQTTLVIKKLTKQKQTWYLTGYSKKEALKHIVFDGLKPNQNVIDIFWATL